MVWETVDIRGIDVEAQEAPDLTDQTLAAIEALFDRYPTRQAALLPALHLAQEQIGYLPPKVLARVADLVGIAPAQVLDVVSFYEMYWQRPKGRKLVQVCRSISCALCGQAGLLEAIKTRLGIDEGETTEDGQFTLIAVECLAACDQAPVVLVNETLHEKVTAADLDEILKVDETAGEASDETPEADEASE
jgi:NADH-quinone oxidoreductase subunit E